MSRMSVTTDPNTTVFTTPRFQSECGFLEHVPWAPDPAPPVHLFMYGMALGILPCIVILAKWAAL